MIWLSGGALAVCLLMIAALLALIVMRAGKTFWPAPLVEVTLLDGRKALGEPTRAERYQPGEATLANLPEADRRRVRSELEAAAGTARRRLLRTGNYELTNEHFTWVSDFEIRSESTPDWAVVLERQEWGRFYGTPQTLLRDGRPLARSPADVWAEFCRLHPEARARWAKIQSLKTHSLGELNLREENARLARVEAALDFGSPSPQLTAADARLAAVQRETQTAARRIQSTIAQLAKENARYELVLATAGGVEHKILLADVVRGYPANRLTWGDKLDVYASRWWEFLVDRPREANSEGGAFPALWGTIVMTLIMALAVAPFGVLAALYLREYAKAGPVVSAVRIAINNLSGVPSIVFGVFGLGFFCYIVGAYLDGGPRNVRVQPWNAGPWWATLAALAVCAASAFFLGLYNLAGRKAEMTVRKRIFGYASVALWLAASVLLVLVLLYTPYFDGFYRAKLLDARNPTYGKGALIWSSLTLALLTLPVVIVATEEALSAVPNSMREGSFACGASKWQTIRRIVLPRAMPGILTGMILAMARGAGEVAPLMLVGAVKLAQELPVDLSFPFLHPDRSFMHMGFHIYDLGFQSQNSEAAAPMVFTTTLLLIAAIALLNVLAIWLRARLRRRFVGGQF